MTRPVVGCCLHLRLLMDEGWCRGVWPDGYWAMNLEAVNPYFGTADELKALV